MTNLPHIKHAKAPSFSMAESKIGLGPIQIKVGDHLTVVLKIKIHVHYFPRFVFSLCLRTSLQSGRTFAMIWRRCHPSLARLTLTRFPLLCLTAQKCFLRQFGTISFCAYVERVWPVARVAYTFVGMFPFCEEVFYMRARISFFAYNSFVCRASSLYLSCQRVIEATP